MDEGWLSLNHLFVVVSAPDLTGRIDRWWHQLPPTEQQCVLDNAEHLPERFLAGLSAAGIGAPGTRLPDCVRRHLHRIDIPTDSTAQARQPRVSVPRTSI